MKILIDTNVLLDAMLGRDAYFENADKVIALCAFKKVDGYIAAHSITDMFYIMRKDMPADSRRDVLLKLCSILSVECIDADKVITSLNNRNFSDLEDCIISECAKSISADYIVTRNIKDFSTSKIPAVSPESFLIMFNGWTPTPRS